VRKSSKKGYGSKRAVLPIMTMMIMNYLTTLSVSKIVQYLTAGRFVNNRLDNVWKEAMAAESEVLFQHLPREAKEDHDKLHSV
jgi:hypothetical protein